MVKIFKNKGDCGPEWSLLEVYPDVGEVSIYVIPGETEVRSPSVVLKRPQIRSLIKILTKALETPRKKKGKSQ